MTPSIKEQVETLRSVGLPDSEISETLGIDLSEIDKSVEEPKEEPVEEPKEEPKSSAKTPPNAYTREEFEEAKRLSAEGRTNIAIAMAQNRSASFVGRALKNDTFEDFLELRRLETERKREEYHDNKAIKKQTNADRRRARQRTYEATKSEAKKLDKSMAQLYTEQLEVFKEIRDELKRIADNTQKKRWFRK